MVDIVHHSVIGLGGALVAQQLGQTDIAAGFLIGSVIPDIDAAFMMLGKSKYLTMHQSITHSIFVLPFIALGAGGLLAATLGASWLFVAIGCLLGSLLHVGFDALNSFGVRALWPLHRRFALDAFFFIDIYVFCASVAVTFALVEVGHPLLFAGIWVAFIGLYVAFKVWWRSLIVKDAAALTAVPSGVMPLSYFLTRSLDDGRVQVGVCSGLRRQVVWGEITPHLDDALLDQVRKGKTFGNLEVALKLFRPVSVTHDGASTIVVSRCVAVRNFNNRYGEIASTLVDGEVVDEKAFL